MFYNLKNIIFFYMDFIPGKDNIKNDINLGKIFYNCTNLTVITFDISYNNNINISSENYYYYYPNDLSHAFYNCISLTNLEFRYFKTDAVKEINYMLFNCKNLQHLSFIQSDFSNDLITNMKGMFQNCESLNTIDFSSFYTPQVEIMWDMFKNCKSLKTLDLHNFDTSKVTDMESMFEGDRKSVV